MDQERDEILKAYIQSRTKIETKFVIEEYLFREQLAFINDPDRYVTAVCSVRAGKTTACAADLIHTALSKPGTMGIYITLARTSAKAIVWPELKKILRDYKIACKPNESDLTIQFTNDSWIRLYGGNEETEIEKIRGLSNVELVYLDESQAFRQHIKELVEDIIAKRLYDTNGRCRMIGTPGPIEGGYFYECSKSPAWSHHHWTMHQNPWLLKKSGKTPQELIEADCARKGVTLEDPSIQRECFGVWKRDPEALLLQYEAKKNDFDELPKKNDYTYILGVDFGQNDLNFLSLLAFSDSSPVTYLIEEKGAPNQLTDDLAKDIKALMKDYPIAKIVCDTGGLGKALAEDLKARYGLPMEPADKTGKMSNYALLNNALRTSMFKAKAKSMFAQDCNILQRDSEKSTPDKIVVKGHSDAVDACLYAFKYSPAYTYVKPPEILKPGTKEYEDNQAKVLFDHQIDKMQKAKEMKDGQGRNWDVDQNMEPSWLKWNDF
jgi:hypothetical protein